MRETQAPVLLTIMDSQRPPVGAQAVVRELGPGTRLRRAVLRLLLFWLVGAGFIIIPFFHFFVPVLCVLASPYFAFRVFQQRVLLSAGQVPCPRCAVAAEVPGGTPGWPATLYCGSCGSTFFARPTG